MDSIVDLSNLFPEFNWRLEGNDGKYSVSIHFDKKFNTIEFTVINTNNTNVYTTMGMSVDLSKDEDYSIAKMFSWLHTQVSKFGLQDED